MQVSPKGKSFKQMSEPSVRTTNSVTIRWLCLFWFFILLFHSSTGLPSPSGKPYEIKLLNSHGPCDFVGLIRCFVNTLDDWAWSLWNIKDNIAMLEDDGCKNHRELGNCVFYEGCSRMEILEASTLVSELLAHQRGATSFLKSYFLADFSCSEEGQIIVHSHRECLLKEHIGDQAIDASTYLEHRLQEYSMNGSDDTYHQCELLKERAELMYRIGEEECPPAGGLLMCRSLIDSFIYLYPNRFEFCDVTCNVPKSTSLPPYLDELPSDDVITNRAGALNHGQGMEYSSAQGSGTTPTITASIYGIPMAVGISLILLSELFAA